MTDRGPSRDRTLPGKRRIRMRRFMKWHEEHGEKGLYAGLTYREIEAIDE